MEHLPKRTSLVLETAATLKEWIATGVLRDVLPGELQLKRRLRVGRDTLRLALKSLTDEGWVSPSSKGRQRWVNTQHPSLAADPNATKLPARFLSPKPIETVVTFLEMEDTRLRLAEQGRQVRFLAPAVFHLKQPEYHLERLVRANPSCAWILFMATDPMQRWFEREGLPAFIYGSPFPGVGLPYVVSNWEEAAYHAGVQLVRRGHRVIGIMEYHVQFPGVLREEQGLERALEVLKGEGKLLRFKDDRTPDSIAKALESAFSIRDRPTALVFTYTAQLLTCYSWMVSKGLRVPGDVSMISLANDSWFDDLHPRLCYYRPDTRLMSRSIADRVLELVETGRVTKEDGHIRLEYVPGATIGPPPAQRG